MHSPQLPALQNGVLPEQLEQRPPDDPQSPTVVPDWHAEPSQQPPLQGLLGEQTEEQVPALHACPAGQSVAELQKTQAPVAPQLGVVPEQVAHAPPDIPHAPAAVPAWHDVPSQQPPLQGELGLQVVEQTPVLHACPTGQLAAVMQCGELSPVSVEASESGPPVSEIVESTSDPESTVASS
jgi:hypothetical protein